MQQFQHIGKYKLKNNLIPCEFYKNIKKVPKCVSRYQILAQILYIMDVVSLFFAACFMVMNNMAKVNFRMKVKYYDFQLGG